MKILKYFFCCVLCFISLSVHAGGDYVAVSIITISITKEKYFFELKQVDSGKELMIGCEKFSVYVQYKRVPWYSFFQFEKTPTKNDTRKAVEYITNAFYKKHSIYFGYIGNGLVSRSEQCSFDSLGLKLDNDVVFSFYDPV